MAAQSEARSGTSELEVQACNREIGNEAVWSLSTAKPGNGADAGQEKKRRGTRDASARARARTTGDASFAELEL